jgi:hypothetical protein
VTSTWAEGVAHALDDALALLATAIRACDAAAWDSPMWPVEGAAGDPRLERRATPWGIAWHTLEVFDYDLTGEFAPWSPPPPFAGHPHWRDLATLPAAWTHDELIAYVAYCRARAAFVVPILTDTEAARPLPAAHRRAGQPYAGLVIALIGHTTEHAVQIRGFAGRRQ